MKVGKLLFAVLIGVGFATAAKGGCICQCVNGQMQPLCDSSIDLPPLCPLHYVRLLHPP